MVPSGAVPPASPPSVSRFSWAGRALGTAAAAPGAVAAAAAMVSASCCVSVAGACRSCWPLRWKIQTAGASNDLKNILEKEVLRPGVSGPHRYAQDYKPAGTTGRKQVLPACAGQLPRRPLRGSGRSSPPSRAAFRHSAARGVGGGAPWVLGGAHERGERRRNSNG